MPDTSILVIFDLDGTLVDSVMQIGRILNQSRLDLGYTVKPESYYTESLGLPLEILIGDLNISKIERDCLSSHFRSELTRDIRKGNNRLFPGVLECLEYLFHHNFVFAIATSKPTRIACEVYENSGLKQFPIHIQGTDGFPAKPNPEVINRVLAFHPGLRAIMVGDRTEDIYAARRAGIPAIGIAASAHSQLELIDVGASTAFESFEDFHLSLKFDINLLSTLPFL
jgi:phosphoglycolate phosphatase